MNPLIALDHISWNRLSFKLIQHQTQLYALYYLVHKNDNHSFRVKELGTNNKYWCAVILVNTGIDNNNFIIEHFF